MSEDKFDIGVEYNFLKIIGGGGKSSNGKRFPKAR